MAIASKEEILKMLREDATFKKALAAAKDDTERRTIKAYTEDFVMKFYKNIFEPMHRTGLNNSETVRNMFTKMNDELIKSGSAEIITERDGRPEKPRT